MIRDHYILHFMKGTLTSLHEEMYLQYYEIIQKASWKTHQDILPWRRYRET